MSFFINVYEKLNILFFSNLKSFKIDNINMLQIVK